MPPLRSILVACLAPLLAFSAPPEPATPTILIDAKVIGHRDGKENLLSAPRVATRSGQQASIEVGNERIVALPEAGVSAREKAMLGLTLTFTPELRDGRILLRGTFSRKEAIGEPLTTPTLAQLSTRADTITFVALAEPGKVVKLGFGEGPAPVVRVELTVTLEAPPVSAATRYWQAFAAAPQLGKEESALLAKKLAEPLDTEAATALAAKFEPSLKLLAQGAALPACDWSLDLTQGPRLTLPHLGKAQELSRALRLRARLRIETGDVAGANEDGIAALRFARHVGEPGLLLTNLVRIAQESAAIELAARRLGKLDRPSLQRLADALGALPPAHTVVESIAAEKTIFLDWMRQTIGQVAAKGGDEKAQFAEILALMGGGTGDDAQEANRAIVGDSLPALRTMLDGLERDYAALSGLLALPPAQAGPQLAAFEKRVQAGKENNPLAAATLPAVAKVHAKDARHTATLALFRAGVLVQRDGRAALTQLRDPFGDGPFDFVETAGGFELRSKLTADGKPVTLAFGR